MLAKIYWNLVLFGVLYQGIIGTLSEKNTDESSELLVRQKRVINRRPGQDLRAILRNVPYIVSIKEFRGTSFCAGVILTQQIVLTIAECVELSNEKYRVYSGSGRIASGSHPVIHNILDKKILVDVHPYRPADGVALLVVHPLFVYSINIHNIQIHNGFISSGTLGTVSGWGCNPTGDPGTEHREHLRSITVPIISYQECAIMYLNHHAITERDICTLDTTGLQYCGGAGDVGAPLVIKVGGTKQLVGLHLWKGKVVGQSNPEVFVDLRNSRYRTWIKETVRNIERHVYHPAQSSRQH